MMSYKFISMHRSLKQIMRIFLLGIFIAIINVFSVYAASDYYTTISFNCPTINPTGTDSHLVKNDGKVIQGLGTEFIDNKQRPEPLFIAIAPEGVPLNLRTNGYHNSSTLYDPAASRVNCLYATIQPFPPFKLSFEFKKGSDGAIVSQNANSITIRYVWGYKS